MKREVTKLVRHLLKDNIIKGVRKQCGGEIFTGTLAKYNDVHTPLPSDPKELGELLEQLLNHDLTTITSYDIKTIVRVIGAVLKCVTKGNSTLNPIYVDIPNRDTNNKVKNDKKGIWPFHNGDFSDIPPNRI